MFRTFYIRKKFHKLLTKTILLACYTILGEKTLFNKVNRRIKS